MLYRVWLVANLFRCPCFALQKSWYQLLQAILQGCLWGGTVAWHRSQEHLIRSLKSQSIQSADEQWRLRYKIHLSQTLGNGPASSNPKATSSQESQTAPTAHIAWISTPQPSTMLWNWRRSEMSSISLCLAGLRIIGRIPHGCSRVRIWLRNEWMIRYEDNLLQRQQHPFWGFY